MQEIPDRMSGMLLVGHGGVEKLELSHTIDVPRPGRSDVLVRVAAAGVNNTDINTRTAWYSKNNQDASDATWSGQPLQFPRIQGADVCGTIVQVGRDISEARLGERVLIEPCIREARGEVLRTPWYFGSECDGGFAEFAVVAGRHAYKIESSLTNAELASFPCSYSTAENMLTRAGVTSGDRLLVTGASGGVGSAAIQLAKARGAHVTALTSATKSEALIEIGADQTIDRHADLVESLGANSLDVVIDLVAGAFWPAFPELLRPGGRYAVAGAIGGPIVELDIRTLYLKDLQFFGCTILEPEVFGNLIRLIEDGQIDPLVAQTFPLDKIVQAQAEFQKKEHIGKIVLLVDHAEN